MDSPRRAAGAARRTTRSTPDPTASCVPQTAPVAWKAV
ncbi:Uncharacterised protein [Mycobacteroides abscessus subsp. abscessus]|nr:Uncharacterised protein [Mycobacteroides abscessus subsp. abscessus]